MVLRGVEELMDLLYAGRGVWDGPSGGTPGVDVLEHALQTAALLRRSRPADKELQVTGLVHPIGRLLCPADAAARAEHAADAVRPLLGERVAGLVRRQPWHGAPADDDLLSLRQADEDARVAG
ncbi:inositol oxygenase, partial [Streptomyces sp. A012304]|uniref:inositol oxygenase n=1 Tax=Streptomyces sp. A012304 TaxID=375446 RepID=UPI002231C80B